MYRGTDHWSQLPKPPPTPWWVHQLCAFIAGFAVCYLVFYAR